MNGLLEELNRAHVGVLDRWRVDLNGTKHAVMNNYLGTFICTDKGSDERTHTCNLCQVWVSMLRLHWTFIINEKTHQVYS